MFLSRVHIQTKTPLSLVDQYLYKEVKDISILYHLLVSNNEELSIAKELAINMAR